MTELAFIKELMAVIGGVTAILITIGGGVLWLLRVSFKKGKLYQLFETLVEKVSSIEELIDEKFIDNEAKHRSHDIRITTLEVINNVEKRTETKN